MKYAAVIYNSHNIIIRVEERPTLERAIIAGKFFTKKYGWFKIVEEEDIEFYKNLMFT